MPKEIATKTKGEIHPIRESTTSNGASYKCLPAQILNSKICLGTHCGDEIYWNTHKSMTYCKCKALGVDGCEFYVRLIGNEADREEIRKERKQ